MDEVLTLDLTSNQSLLWTGQLLQQDSPMYNMAFAHHIHHALNTVSFEEAFRKLVATNPVMRSTVSIINDKPQIVIASNFHALTTKDWSEYDIQTIESKLIQRSQVQFDLSTSMYDASLIKVAQEHYIFFLNQHHIITDGWSVSIQFKQLIEIYEGLIKNKGISTDEAVHKDSLKAAIEIDEDAKVYWSDLLKNNSIPAPHYNTVNTRYSSTCYHQEINLDEKQYDRLIALVQRAEFRSWTNDQSIFIVLMTIMVIVESRLKRETTVTIGTPAHGRYTKEDREALGLFIKIFPVVIQLEYKDTFSSLYQKVKLQINSFMKYSQRVESTGELVKSFNSLLNFINVDTQVKGYKISSNWISTGHMDPNHDLKIQVYNFNKIPGFTISFDFNTDIFRKSQVGTISTMYMDLLECMIEDPSLSISTLSDTEEERLSAYNESEHPYPTDTNIVELIAKSVNLYGDQIAIRSSAKSYTYTELDEAANRVANHILEKDIQSETVCVCLERNTDMPIVLLGILKSGKAYVPIDPYHPIERQRYILDHTQSDLLITNINVEISDERLIKYSEIENSNTSSKDPAIKVLPNNLMYIIYTSGSTGAPKGVRNLHSGLVNRLLWAQRKYNLKSSVDKVLQKTNYCFDVSVWELFWPLLAGAELVLADPKGHKNSDYLIEAVEHYNITMMHFVPPMMEVFLQSLTGADRCKSLRKILASGEALKTTHALECKRLLPNVELHNLYGPTEAAIDVTAQQVLPTNEPINFISIGRPIDNTKVYVLDPLLRKCNTGAPGEIYLSGIQVADGYHRDEEKTNTLFINNPFDVSPYNRLYNTGDLGYWNQDGTISYIGRNDFQVKLRGYRIELEEISSTIIKRNNEISQAISIVTNKDVNPQIVSFVVSNNKIQVEKVKSILLEFLPAYMIPTYVVQIEKIPTTSNGKIDRKALANIEIVLTKERVSTLPKNEIEEIVHAIWVEVLGRSHGVDQSFFSVGGDSLSGIKVILRINKAFELSLPVVDIWKYSTIASLAIHVEETIIALLSKMED